MGYFLRLANRSIENPSHLCSFKIFMRRQCSEVNGLKSIRFLKNFLLKNKFELEGSQV